MQARSWKLHGIRLAAAALVLATLGWLSGHTSVVLCLAAVLYLLWHLVNLVRLHTWLQNPQQDIPASRGIWDSIFGSINALEQQNQQQKAAYQDMITEFQNLTNAFPDATLVIDSQNLITWSNQAAVPLLGLRLPDDIGQTVTHLVRDPDFAEWLAMHESLKGGLEMPSPVNDNQWLHVTAVPFQEDQRLIILRNITELHNVEQLRRDFVANISHELRTPVTVLTGYLELLSEHPQREISEPVARMQSQALQMRTLLDDLLELSRLQNDEIHSQDTAIDIASLLRQLQEQAEEISHGRHTLHFEVDQNLRITGVAHDIASAFGNLIGNAIRYTPESGAIHVRWQDSAEGPLLSVKDTGVGIPKRHIPRLTERFYRVSPDRSRQSGGTGLGLAIVKHVMNAHRAKLLIHSELGEGSEFVCVFPLARRVLLTTQEAAHAQ